MLKYLYAAALIAAAMPALAASQVQPMAITGQTSSGYLTATPIGNGAGGSLGVMPVNPMAGDSQYALTLASAKTLTVPTGASGALITVENNATYSAGISFTVDGTTPTSSTGHQYPAGTTLAIPKPWLSVIKFIQLSSSASIDVTYLQ